MIRPQDPVPIRVLLASELRLVREAVAAALCCAGAFEVTQVGADIADITRAAHAATPDVLLLSPAQTLRPESPGARLSVIGLVRGALPHVPVVMLGPAPSAAVARAALAEGAFAYVLKDEGLGDLADAVRAAADWQPYVGPVLREWFDAEPAASPGGLSGRDLDVITLIARGRTNEDIAAALDLSVRSIEAIRARVARRLGATSRSGLVDAAIDLGLVL